MSKICIIMATYNGEKYLEEQIDSILNNSFKDITLHIQDDGSTDRTTEIIDSYARKYPDRVTGHRNTTNKGVIRNFLEAVSDLEGDYYMFCDQDDVWLPSKIEKTLSTIVESEKQLATDTPVVVFGDATVVNQNLVETAPSFQRQSGYDISAIDLPHLMMENKLIGCTIMFNKALRNKLCDKPLPDTIRMHDWWIALLGAALGKVVYLDEPLLLYRQHEKNVVGNITRKSYIKDRISHLRESRQALYATCAQAGSFLKIYQKELSPDSLKLLETFSQLPEKNWFKRRYLVLRYGFLKSGLIRNIGILLLI